MGTADGDEARRARTPAAAALDGAGALESTDRGDSPAVRDGLPEFIEKFAAILIAAGFPPMPARVFGALLVTDSGRLTAAELVDLLQISPAAVSGAVRYLSGLGLVHKERVPGSRREYYRMPSDIWHQVMMLRSQVLLRWAALLKEGIDLVGRDTPAGRRMTGHAAYFEFLAAEMPAVLARWDAASRSGLRTNHIAQVAGGAEPRPPRGQCRAAALCCSRRRCLLSQTARRARLRAWFSPAMLASAAAPMTAVITVAWTSRSRSRRDPMPSQTTSGALWFWRCAARASRTCSLPLPEMTAPRSRLPFRPILAIM